MSLLADLAITKFQPPPPMVPKLDSVENPMTGLGGPYDKGAVARPSQWTVDLDPSELRTLFRQTGIAHRLVTIRPERAVRRGWAVPDMEQWDEDNDVWARVGASMTWAGLYGGCGAMMVTEDDVPAGFKGRPEEWLRQPLDLQRVGKFCALQPFDANEATIARYDYDVRSMGYRGPAEWQISAPGFRSRVHASRVIWFRGVERPPSDLAGGWNTWSSRTLMPDDSYLQHVWNQIMRLEQTLQGGATMAQELRESVLTIGKLPQLATSDQSTLTMAKIRLIALAKSLIGMIVLNDGDKYENRSNPPTGFQELSAGAWEALAAVTGIPQVILMGSTPGGLNTDGESSWEGFRQLISSYQDRHLPQLRKLYTVAYASQDGPTRGRIPDRWSVKFHPLDEPNEAAMAETRGEVATADEAMIRSGVLTAEDVRRKRFGENGWTFEMGDCGPMPVKPAPTPAPGPAPTPGVPGRNAPPEPAPAQLG